MCKRKSWMSKVCEQAVWEWRGHPKGFTLPGSLGTFSCPPAGRISPVPSHFVQPALLQAFIWRGPLWGCLAKCLSAPQTDT